MADYRTLDLYDEELEEHLPKDLVGMVKDKLGCQYDTRDGTLCKYPFTIRNKNGKSCKRYCIQNIDKWIQAVFDEEYKDTTDNPQYISHITFVGHVQHPAKELNDLLQKDQIVFNVFNPRIVTDRTLLEDNDQEVSIGNLTTVLDHFKIIQITFKIHWDWDPIITMPAPWKHSGEGPYMTIYKLRKER